MKKIVFAILTTTLISSGLFAENLKGLYIEAEDFDNLEQFPTWSAVKNRWYVKEHLAEGFIAKASTTSPIVSGGAYAVADEFSLNTPMSVKLDETLPPGKYAVWLRVACWNDSDDSVEVDLNGTKTVFFWNIKKLVRGYRWMKKIVETKKAGNTLTLKALTANMKNFGETPRPPCKFMIVDAVYIGPASEKLEIVSERFYDELVPPLAENASTQKSKSTDAASPPAQKEGNLIENGSFEAGVGHGWASLAPYGPLNTAYLDKSSHRFGEYSLRSVDPKDPRKTLSPFCTKLYKIQRQGDYVLSAWFKGTPKKRITLSLNTYHRKEVAPILKKTITFDSDEWRCVHVSGKLEPDDYFVKIEGNGLFMVDGVQLEKGSVPTTYKPFSPVEAGLASDVPGRVFFNNENNTVDLLVACHDENIKDPVRIDCVVDDLWGNEVLSKTFEIQPARHTEKPIDIFPEKTGIFCARLSVEGIPFTRDEFVFSIIPPPKTMSFDPKSWFGAMPEFKPYVLAALQRIGVKWAQNIREFSGRWCQDEREKGKIVFNDERLMLPEKYGMEVVFLLHPCYDRLPKWVEPTPENARYPKDMEPWKNYVRKMAEHYKDRIKYWEFSDDIHHWWNWREHADFLKTTYDVIKSVDPKNVVIGWRYYKPGAPNYAESMKATVPYSDIIYGGDRSTEIETDKAVHNYLFSSSYSMYDDQSKRAPDEKEKSARDRRLSATNNIGKFADYAAKTGKVDCLQLYMPRIPGAWPYAINEKMSKSTFEYDGALNIGMITYAILNHLLPVADCVGEVRLKSPLKGCVFDQHPGTMALVWAEGGEKTKMGLSDPKGKLSFYDAMGNEVTPMIEGDMKFVTLRDTPVYVSSPSAAPKDLSDKLKTASVRREFEINRYVSVSDDSLSFNVVVKNNSDKAVDIETWPLNPALFPLPFKADPTREIKNLEPGRERKIAYPLRYHWGRNVEYTVTDLLFNISGTRFSKHWMLWILNSKRVKSPIRFTGKLDDWNGVLPVRLLTTQASSSTRRTHQVRSKSEHSEEELTQGRQSIIRNSQDLSADIYSEWNERNLCFAFKINDDSVEPGDQFELYFAPNESKLDDDVRVLSCDFGTGAQEATIRSGKDKWSIPVLVSPSAGGVLVELAVPWKIIGVDPEKTRIIGFDTVLKDADKGAPHAELVWAGSKFQQGDPDGFGYLTFGE